MATLLVQQTHTDRHTGAHTHKHNKREIVINPSTQATHHKGSVEGGCLTSIQHIRGVVVYSYFIHRISLAAVVWNPGQWHRIPVHQPACTSTCSAWMASHGRRPPIPHLPPTLPQQSPLPILDQIARWRFTWQS